MKKKQFLFLFSLMLAAACAPVVANRGNIVEDERLQQVVIGTSTKAEVQTTLGPPSMLATFDPNLWYYTGKRTKRTAFLDPETSYERTIAIAFDAAGVVQNIQEIDPKSAMAIDPVERRTPTAGKDMNVFEQLLDNMSRPGLPGSLGDKDRRR